VTSSPNGRTVARLALVLVAFLVVGAIAGAVWEWLWTPPTGVSVEGEWYLDAEGVQDDFSGTGLYVLVAVMTGAVLGLVSALSARSHELITLAVVAAGSLAAGWVMALTGSTLGPPDPRPLAGKLDDYTAIPADLRVVGAAPYAAFPTGALTALAACFVGLDGSRRSRLDREPDG